MTKKDGVINPDLQAARQQARDAIAAIAANTGQPYKELLRFVSFPYVTVDEAAVILQVSPKTVRRYVTTGDLPSHPIGPSSRPPRLYSLEDLENFVAKRRRLGR